MTPVTPARTLDDVIDHFVSLVLSHIDKEYPNKLDHVMNGPEEVLSPRTMHPIFFGSYDWHSSVHGHWLLVRALRLFPKLAQAAEVRALLDARFTAEKVAAEIAYLGQKSRGTFERTYGWAWLLKLAAELHLPPTSSEISPQSIEAMARWRQILQPLTAAFVDRFVKYLPKATYPIRVGTHNNTAFALALALDYARPAGQARHPELAAKIDQRAGDWYLKDAAYHGWEPDGTDFITPGLMEAECLRRVLPPDQFAPWFERFLPNLADRRPEAMFTPAIVSDRTDAQITHLDGLNLCRAWCWRSLARVLPEGKPRQLMEETAKAHLEAALPHVSGDYVGEHWLATFALLALTE